MSGISMAGILEIVGEIVDLSGADTSVHARFGEDIPVDSRDMLRILSRLESRYRFRFPPGEILKLQTLGDLLESVRRAAPGR